MTDGQSDDKAADEPPNGQRIMDGQNDKKMGRQRAERQRYGPTDGRWADLHDVEWADGRRVGRGTTDRQAIVGWVGRPCVTNIIFNPFYRSFSHFV